MATVRAVGPSLATASFTKNRGAVEPAAEVVVVQVVWFDDPLAAVKRAVGVPAPMLEHRE